MAGGPFQPWADPIPALYNAKTGKRGEPPAQGLHSALSTLVFLTICFLLLSWANGS